MADVENQNFLDEPLVPSGEAEPDERARCTVIVIVAVLTLSLTAVAWVLINVYEYDQSPETSRLTVAALVVGLLLAALAFCAWILLLLIVGDWELGNPEGYRFVDTLLSI
jgi:fatty acid desaturase